MKREAGKIILGVVSSIIFLGLAIAIDLSQSKLALRIEGNGDVSAN
jgi:hypothetical protein